MILQIIGWFCLGYGIIGFIAMTINIAMTGKTFTDNGGVEFCLLLIAAAICFK